MAFGDDTRAVALVYYPTGGAIPDGVRPILVPTFSTETLPDSVQRIVGYGFSASDTVPDGLVKYAAIYCSADQWASARPELRRVVGQPLALLGERFLTDRAAGTLGGQTVPCEPGPGSLTYTDTEGKLSVAGGKLVCSGGKTTPGWGDPQWSSGAIARTCGVALIGRWKPTAGQYSAFGFYRTAGLPSDEFSQAVLSLRPVVPNIHWRYNAAFYDVAIASGIALGTEYDLAVVLRGAGGYLLMRQVGASQWTVIAVANADSTATVYACAGSYNTAQEFSNLRVLSLAALDSRFATDDGLCTSVLTNPESGATAAMEPDAIVEAVVTYDGTPWGIDVRSQDINNRLYIVVAGGDLYLSEVIAGADTNRGVAAAFPSNGVYRVVVILTGNVWQVFVNNVLKLTYTDTNNLLLTATGIKQNAASGGVSRLAAYPRTISLPVGV